MVKGRGVKDAAPYKSAPHIQKTPRCFDNSRAFFL